VLLTLLKEHHPDTYSHSLRVADIACYVGVAMALPINKRTQLVHAALLHDIGKLDIPVELLDSDQLLSDEQRATIEQHSASGEATCFRQSSTAHIAEFVRGVHERYDGGGYPDGLHGQEIPLPARILAVCDAYDAMRDPNRKYRSPLTDPEAVAVLEANSGSQFDPEVVAVFLGLPERWLGLSLER
jgi:putative two-component system response regulator